MYCDQCGMLVSAGSKFCAQCGNKVSGDSFEGRKTHSDLSTASKGPPSWTSLATVTVYIAAVLIGSVLLYVLYKATSGGYPSEAVARKVFENQHREQVNGGWMEILSFRKTNGQLQEMFGVKLYTIEYEADIRYPKGINSNCAGPGFQGWDCWFATLGGGQVRQKGEVEKRRDKITFEHTEKGWKGPDGQIYSLTWHTSLVPGFEGAGLKETPTTAAGSVEHLRKVAEEIKVAKAQIELLSTALDTFRLDVGRYPTTEEGLEALRKRPGGLEKWDGPYLKKEVPLDPWGKAYLYKSPGEHGPFDVISYGADAVTGGDGDNRDITSWER